MEKLFYEVKPYLLLALSIYVLSAEEPKIVLIIAGLVLLIASTLILRMRLRARKGSTVESAFYEAQPFLYLAIGGYALYFLKSSKFAVGCALLLMTCGVLILNWRYEGRR
jgi:hypothetical protein